LVAAGASRGPILGGRFPRGVRGGGRGKKPAGIEVFMGAGEREGKEMRGGH